MRRFMSTASAVIIAIGASGWASVMPAHAATSWPANCADLQTTLDGTGAGDTVTLHDTNLCPGAFTLPGRQITLQGQTQADGFDGGGVNRSLYGNNIGAAVIQNLTFINGFTAIVGGALAIDGDSSPTIRNDVFMDNHADTQGGAIKVQVSGDLTLVGNVFGAAGHPNTTNGAGGAVAAFTLHASVTNNQFLYNSTASPSGFEAGGGVMINTSAQDANEMVFNGNTLLGNQTAGANGAGANLSGSGTLTISGNTFRGNVIAATTGNTPSGRGGGLAVNIFGTDATAKAVQSGNFFDSNVIHTQTFKDGSSPVDFGGAGELAQAPLVTSVNDTFVNNHVDAGAGGNTAVGGGLALQGNNGNKTTLNASNLVAVNNSVGAGGEGGGIYAGFVTGCVTPPCTAAADIFDSTLANNSSGGTGAQMGGNQADTAHVVNSIVIGPVGTQTDIEGFGTTTVSHSDTCLRGTPYTGTGNLCQDPRLANVAGNNVHETSASPTIDKGDNAQVPAGLSQDYEGDPRIIGTAVDMGADEFNPPPPTPPRPGTRRHPRATRPACGWPASAASPCWSWWPAERGPHLQATLQ